MAQSFDCVLMNGTVVNQDGIGERDVGVRDGRIAEIGALGQAAAGERIDCRGLHILPGVIDSQVHFREPGLVHKEDLETGSRGAVLGGVTAVFEMPNTDPLTTSAEALADKLAVPPFPPAQAFGSGPAPIWRIRAEATMPDGVTFAREAVLRRSPDAQRPLIALAWLEPSRSVAPPSLSSTAPDGIHR